MSLMVIESERGALISEFNAEKIMKGNLFFNFASWVSFWKKELINKRVSYLQFEASLFVFILIFP